MPFHILLKNHELGAEAKGVILAMCSKKDINANAQDGNGMTLLHLACKNYSLSLIRFLISNFQCDVNLPDNKRNLPLHYAVEHGRSCSMDTTLELVQLVGKGCMQIHAKNDDGITPLCTAYSNRNRDVVRYLIFHDTNPFDISLFPASENLAIHFVCQKEEDLDLLKLLATKHNVNQFDYLDCTDASYGSKYATKSTPLHVACAYSNIPAVQLLGELNCDFSLKDSKNSLPLHIACSISQSLECVKLLKIDSVDLKAVDRDGNTPLHLACKHGCTDIVKYLLTMHGCDINIKNRMKELPLHLASSTTVEIVQRVSKCDTNCQNENGDTPLHIACKAGALDIVTYLVHNYNCRDSMTLENISGRLPIHYACENSLEMVKLVAEPCTMQNLIAKERDGYVSPLDIACSHGLLDLVAYLIFEKGCSLSVLQDNQSALGYASGYYDYPSKAPHLGVVEFLITKCGYDPSKSIDIDYSAAPIFERVCRTNNLKLLKALTVCSVDIQDSSGSTPLHYACQYSCIEIVRHLISCDCDQTILNDKGELALHLACCQSSIITRMLTKCDVNTLNLNGNAPLHIACGRLDTDNIVAYLVKEAKCDVNIPDETGRYALHITCAISSLKTTKLLLQRCEVNCQDADGNTALHIACSKGSYEVITTLLENSQCRADIPNKSGDLPLHSFMKWSSISRRTEFSAIATTDELLSSRQLQVIEIILNRFGEAARVANQDGITPTQIAIIKRKITFLQLLHQRNELDFTSTGNKTLLHIACLCREAHMVHWLLEHGANTSFQDEGGNYPEHLCIDCNSSLKHYLHDTFDSDASIKTLLC